MIFKRMLGALGVGAPTVDTVLAAPRVQPGASLRGEVRLKGGDFDAEIEHIALGLVAKVEAEHGEGEQTGLIEFFHTVVSGTFTLSAGEDRAVPFELPVPWESPLTEVAGQHLSGMVVGVRTELAIAKAVDKGDLDLLQIAPLASQETVLRAMAHLGFRVKSADLEIGHIRGVDQQLPFYQEIEFYPPPAYAGRINEVEFTFVADPDGMTIVLEADKRSGGHGSGGDAFARWTTGHDEAPHQDWAAEINGWLASIAQYATGGSHYGGHESYAHDHGSHHGGGHGLGGLAAGAAVGFVAAEVIDEIGDFFEGDEE
jgi:sporulation-control protein